MKNIFLITVILIALDLAILSILKVLDKITKIEYISFIQDSLLVIGILFVLGIIISFIAKR